MIGKMQDMVTAAVVVSAADNKGSRYTSETKASSQNTQSEGNAVVKSAVQTDGVDAINAAGNPQQTGDEQQENQDSKNPLSHEFVSEMTRELNELMSKLNCDLEFQYHKEVGVMSVKMVDKNTKEVIKEYPPEEMVEGMIKAQEWLGAFLDKKA